MVCQHFLTKLMRLKLLIIIYGFRSWYVCDVIHLYNTSIHYIYIDLLLMHSKTE